MVERSSMLSDGSHTHVAHPETAATLDSTRSTPSVATDKKARQNMAATVDAHPASPDTLAPGGEQDDSFFRDVPPPLNYTIKTFGRERTILVWFTLLFLEAGVLPLILFFALRWGAHLSTTVNLAIITSLIGSVSGYKFAQRMWGLWYARDHHTRRPIGAGRWGVDFFQ
jgi:hypothetical protein